MSSCIFWEVSYLGKIWKQKVRKTNMKESWKRKCRLQWKYCVKVIQLNLQLIFNTVKTFALKINQIMLIVALCSSQLWLELGGNMILNGIGKILLRNKDLIIQNQQQNHQHLFKIIIFCWEIKLKMILMNKKNLKMLLLSISTLKKLRKISKRS